tara:strand:- start:609 stop:1559 length:951 start_codon:yes stop_codon:yes gene_type:complete
MKNKIITRISNGFGNQMFLYASSFAFSRELNSKFFLDVFSGINQLKKKNLSKNFKHFTPKFELTIFNISAIILSRENTFDTKVGYFKRKFLIFFNKFSTKKNFIVETKNYQKKTYFSPICSKLNFKKKIYVEGYFESEKYFAKYRNSLIKEFSFKEGINCSHKYLDLIQNSNSVSLAFRRDRFTETLADDSDSNKINKTNKFDNDQFDYIIRSINFFKNKFVNPKFFLFSDNFDNLETMFSKINNLTFVIDNNENKIVEDFYLMTKCKHFAVAPTSFHWWAAWLNNGHDKICLRPKNDSLNPSNNKDFWPENWLKI